MAELQEDEEITLTEFCSRLYRHWGMVIDDASAKDAGLDNEINSAVFDRNAKVDFASVLKRMGFLREFSDATQMVGIAG